MWGGAEPFHFPRVGGGGGENNILFPLRASGHACTYIYYLFGSLSTGKDASDRDRESPSGNEHSRRNPPARGAKTHRHLLSGAQATIESDLTSVVPFFISSCCLASFFSFSLSLFGLDHILRFLWPTCLLACLLLLLFLLFLLLLHLYIFTSLHLPTCVETKRKIKRKKRNKYHRQEWVHGGTAATTKASFQS